jgi:hypothetical protein
MVDRGKRDGGGGDNSGSRYRCGSPEGGRAHHPAPDCSPSEREAQKPPLRITQFKPIGFKIYGGLLLH